MENAGIMVAGQSCPLLEDNVCFLNGKVGIIYEHTTNPIIRNNRCLGNAKAEIFRH
ncbi:MAG: hypothetical protein CBR30_06680 [Dictyoglomus sp. NZ13-RE01]|nr:MAG: hypothetical protein CBR30_06680 [Dictyoglomus sp. NZ13-RE01]